MCRCDHSDCALSVRYVCTRLLTASVPHRGLSLAVASRAGQRSKWTAVKEPPRVWKHCHRCYDCGFSEFPRENEMVPTSHKETVMFCFCWTLHCPFCRGGTLGRLTCARMGLPAEDRVWSPPSQRCWWPGSSAGTKLSVNAPWAHGGLSFYLNSAVAASICRSSLREIWVVSIWH